AEGVLHARPDHVVPRIHVRSDRWAGRPGRHEPRSARSGAEHAFRSCGSWGADGLLTTRPRSFRDERRTLRRSVSSGMTENEGGMRVNYAWSRDTRSNVRRLLVLAMASTAVLALTTGAVASTSVALTKVSHDPYTNTSSYHKTQVEPDTFSFGNTIVATFQTGRFFDGGSSNIGWATSTDNGATWTHGFLPKTTV